jgi:Flp pilus assembly protein TadD
MIDIQSHHRSLSRRSTLLLATALCSVLALSGCASTGAATQGAKSAATPATDSGMASGASKEKSAAALREAAISSTKTQDYVAAAAYWGSLYDGNPNDTEAALNYSKSLRQIGSIAQAVSVMQRAKQAHPDDVGVLAEFGKVLTAAGQPDQAQANLARANQLKPGDWTLQGSAGALCRGAEDRAGQSVGPDQSRSVLRHRGQSRRG